MFSSLFHVLRRLFCAKLSIMQRQSTIRLAGKVPKVRTGRRERQARGANFGKNFIALCHDSVRDTPRGPTSDFRAPSALPLFADNLPEVRTKGSGRAGSSRRRSELSYGKMFSKSALRPGISASRNAVRNGFGQKKMAFAMIVVRQKNAVHLRR